MDSDNDIVSYDGRDGDIIEFDCDDGNYYVSFLKDSRGGYLDVRIINHNNETLDHGMTEAEYGMVGLSGDC